MRRDHGVQGTTGKEVGTWGTETQRRGILVCSGTGHRGDGAWGAEVRGHGVQGCGGMG